MAENLDFCRATPALKALVPETARDFCPSYENAPRVFDVSRFRTGEQASLVVLHTARRANGTESQRDNVPVRLKTLWCRFEGALVRGR